MLSSMLSSSVYSEKVKKIWEGKKCGLRPLQSLSSIVQSLLSFLFCFVLYKKKSRFRNFFILSTDSTSPSLKFNVLSNFTKI